MDRRMPSRRGRAALAKRARGAAVAFVIDDVLVLPIGALVALLWANTAGESYFRVAHALRFAVNDVGMAFFVGIVTEEALEAVMPGGALYRWRRTLLPLVAALGGLLGSVGVYLLYVQSHYEFALVRGWPVAAAMDMAFAYFIAKAVFPRRLGPTAFLLVIALVSNTVGILSLAVAFPVDDRSPVGFALLAAAVLLAALLRAAGLRAMWPYLVTSAPLSWVACYVGGVQPALALLPIIPFLPHRLRSLTSLTPGPVDPDMTPRRLEHVFKYPVQVVLLLPMR
jgi:NhaA family Na+:H+ antiporter